LDVIGSTQPRELGAEPQQALPPVLTRSAASPYFSRTFSFTSMLIFLSLIGVLPAKKPGSSV
jgi:hypothetical protein